MQRKTLVVFGLLMITIFLLTVSVGAAMQDSGNQAVARDGAPKVDDRMDPLTAQQRKMHAVALEAMVRGELTDAEIDDNVAKVAKGQYVELARVGEDPVWTMLGEFDDGLHNEMIAKPDRSVDNSTIWTADFSREYYQGLLFNEGAGVNSMRQYFIETSANRYTVHGDVTDWVPAPDDACTYDDDLLYYPGWVGTSAVWRFIEHITAKWYADQIAAGQTPQQINDYLKQFDVWDRYNSDGDTIFDEPDGYIDHMQFVHAGEGNEAGGGILGDCAIWSHSWYIWYQDIGYTGPEGAKEGGIQIGDSDFWINKYTIQPENGGVGVFTHEYAHDIGTPDLYDYTGENSTGFWTLMSSGSWLSQNDYDIGSAPNHMGVWEKFQLGWLNYEVAFAGSKSQHKMGPAESNTKQAQGLFVVLPDKGVTQGFAPYDGDWFYYSNSGPDLDNFMYKDFDLPENATLTAKAYAQIEEDWDYAYLVASTDGGATWNPVETNLSTDYDPNFQNFGHGITGYTPGWVDLTADLSDYPGTVRLGFRYWTDPFVNEPGFAVDDILISGYTLDGAETDTAGWIFEGYLRSENLSETEYYFNAYVAEYRQYRGYDAGLANAYNFGFDGNLVEHFPYQDGLLISYWDNSFTDNNVGAHCASGRCGGLLLPIDAHPELMYNASGDIWRNRVQTYDATFGLEPTDAIKLHTAGVPSYHPSQPAAKIFDDNNSYYNPENPEGSVITPVTGTQIRVKSVSAQNTFMQVEVRPSK